MQYSLRSLFLATAGVAVLFGVACALPDPLSVAVMFSITLILPGGTVALAYYGRGYPKAFAIGCLLSPTIAALLAIPIFICVAWFDHKDLSEFANDIEHETVLIKLEIVALNVMTIFSGLLAVAVRWWIQSARSRENNARMKLLAMYGKPNAHPVDESFTVFHGRFRACGQEADPLISEEAIVERRPLQAGGRDVQATRP